MHEYTPDQVMFVEEWTRKRDALVLEVGLLTNEKEVLIKRNQEISDVNSSLQSGIDEMNENASRLGFEQAEKINELKIEHSNLIEEIETLKTKKELMSKDLDEKNNTLINLGVLINSIKVATEDTTIKIRNMIPELNKYTSQVANATTSIETEATRVKALTNELSTVVDSERKANYEKSREIDAREIGVIGREKLAEMKYAEVIKQLNEK